MQFGFILALIIAILIAIFAIQNSEPVTIDMFFAAFEISQAIVILVSAAVGAVIVVALGSIKQIKNRSVKKELNTKFKNLESENADIISKITNYENMVNALSSEKATLKEELSKLKKLYDEKCNGTIASNLNNNSNATNISHANIASEKNKLANNEIGNSDKAYLKNTDEKGQTESK